MHLETELGADSTAVSANASRLQREGLAQIKLLPKRLWALPQPLGQVDYNAH